MSPRKEAPARNPKKNSKEPAIRTTEGRLPHERQVAIEADAKALGEDLILFPGKLARRVIWSGKIQLAAERDAADLVRTPFPEEEPRLTLEEIHDQRDRIEYLRVVQSRWRALLVGQKAAAINFETPAAEASRHKETLLRFFTLRYKNNPDGQTWLSEVRAGGGDADLVQDVSDILERCRQTQEAIAAAPRGEARAAARLAELSPTLARLLSAKSLTAEAQEARKLRDAVYTLVIRTERRLRTTAEYWYTGTDRLKDYAVFPAAAAAPSDEGADMEEDEPIAPAPAAEASAGPLPS